MSAVIEERRIRLDAMDDEVNICKACPLEANRFQSVRTHSGRGSLHPIVLFLGMGPGYDEQQQGVPFVGKSGELLEKEWFPYLGITIEDCYICNVVKCRPATNGRNRDPLPMEMEACRHFLIAQMKVLIPQVIVALGKVPDGQLTEMGVEHYHVPHPAYFLRQARLDWRPFLDRLKDRIAYVRTARWF